MFDKGKLSFEKTYIFHLINLFFPSIFNSIPTCPKFGVVGLKVNITVFMNMLI